MPSIAASFAQGGQCATFARSLSPLGETVSDSGMAPHGINALGGRVQVLVSVRRVFASRVTLKSSSLQVSRLPTLCART